MDRFKGPTAADELVRCGGCGEQVHYTALDDRGDCERCATGADCEECGRRVHRDDLDGKLCGWCRADAKSEE